MIGFLKNLLNPEQRMPKELDAFLGAATAEFNVKQKTLASEFRFKGFSSWSFDKHTGILELNFKEADSATFYCQALGTYAPGEGTFEWAWNSPHFQDFLCVDSLKAKALGEKFSVPYLTTGMIPVRGLLNVTYLGAIGVKASGALGLFHNSEGDVQLVLLVIEALKR